MKLKENDMAYFPEGVSFVEFYDYVLSDEEVMQRYNYWKDA